MGDPLTAHLLVSWEVTYEGGKIVRESPAFQYKDIDRKRLAAFTLLVGSVPAFRIECDSLRRGANLVYRSRSKLQKGVTKHWFIVGWVPMGPVWAFCPDEEMVYQAASFDNNDALLWPPIPSAKEGETWVFGDDASRLPHQRITLPGVTGDLLL